MEAEMGCCFPVALLLGVPRLAVVFLAAFTPVMRDVHSTWVWPVLGFLFLPSTTFAYAMSIKFVGPMDNPWSIGICLAAFLLDMGQFGIFRKRKK